MKELERHNNWVEKPKKIKERSLKWYVQVMRREYVGKRLKRTMDVTWMGKEGKDDRSGGGWTV